MQTAGKVRSATFRTHFPGHTWRPPWKADLLQPAGVCHWHWALFKAKQRYLPMARNAVGMRRVPGQSVHGTSHSALARHLNGPEGSPG